MAAFVGKARALGLAAAFGLVALLAGYGGAQADTMEWVFTSTSCTTGCGTGPFGTVDVTDGKGTGGHGLLFTVTTFSPYGFHQTQGNPSNPWGHPAFAFDLDNGTVGYSQLAFSTFTLTDPGNVADPATITSGNTASPAGYSGTFPLALAISQNSAAGAVLTFTVTPTSGTLHTSDITRNCTTSTTTCPYFVADVFLGANTGNAAAINAPRDLPEPASVGLFALALGGLAVIRRRRTSRASA